MSNRCAVYVRVRTDDQRDNGYSIDSQLRMIKEYCEKNDYLIVDVYNDAGHSGKDLMRPEMQRLLKDIKSKKIDKLVAIKVDRLTRNNYYGFWILNYCEQHDVKIELILEPYDVGTANGEMIFGMNLVFGQRERKEIGARTKRAMEEMALSKVHPSKAPYGYIRNEETGHLEIEPIEAQVVKEIFELCKKGHSTRNIASIMKDNNSYLKQGKWRSDRVYKILTNSIYIGIFEYGKYKRKPQDILRVNNYCEPIIDEHEQTWNVTRANLEKNKHSNYGEHIHLFTSIVKCPDCGGILSSTNSFKNSGTEKEKVYYHLTCKNSNCKSKGLHYMVELLKKLDCDYQEDNNILFQNKLGFSFLWDSLNRKTKKELIQRLIASLEITRDKNYNIEIKNIKFTDEFISKSNKEYLNYLNEILNNNEIGIKYKEQINKQELEKLEQDYFIFSTKKYEDNKYSEADLLLYMELIKQHFYQDGIINCPYIEDNIIVDNLLLIRLAYLKEYKKALYTSLLMKEELTNHLISVSKNADSLLNTLMENHRKSYEKLTEKSKEINPIEWAKLMNNYKNTAEEIILKEYIFI